MELEEQASQMRKKIYMFENAAQDSANQRKLMEEDFQKQLRTKSDQLESMQVRRVQFVSSFYVKSHKEQL